MSMNKRKVNKTKYIGIIFTVFCISLFAANIFKLDSMAGNNIAVNKKNFPDKNFRNYVKKVCDKNHDNILSPAEINSVTKILLIYDDDLEYYGTMKDFTGIEYFTNLREFRCTPSSKKELDLSKNKKLEILSVGSYEIDEEVSVKNLILTNNKNLREIYCSSIRLETLKLPKSNQLKILYCYGNNLKKLDVSSNKNLEKLICSFNKLRSLNIKNCKNLKYLDVYQNRLKALDVSAHLKLETLKCKKNKIKKLNLCNNKETLKVSADKKVKITPSKNTFQTTVTKLISLKKSGAGQVNLKIGKDKYSDGYQIIYATNKAFKNARKVYSKKTKRTLKNLSRGKRYYISVKSYIRTPKGKKIYNKASRIRKIQL